MCSSTVCSLSALPEIWKLSCPAWKGVFVSENVLDMTENWKEDT